ncbi:copper homeostasis protein CutC [Paragemmobacter straminiformis]|uniref:PF03932 family protein CutC n=1 Tax=Paragemmobacter straminiformis TaxID=2045119 RepID=A0A842I796_9RHOB|nr:copper homeostasis protein CutC [Gemmobacter straminiformis]MBC2835952.1 copper homeostasis protein CutC [Gemmobacter straminiformis]
MARLLEVCVDTPDGLQAAIEGGADRIELCAALALGGLTPSAGLIEAARSAPRPVLAMIRPRAGGFVWTRAETRAMRHEIAAIRSAGLAGVVLGASNPDGSLDTDTLATLMDEARGMETTLHRCFDLTPDPFAALEKAIALGFRRILTSGQAATAPQGIALIARLHIQAAGRIILLAGGGIMPQNAPLFTAAGLCELHASCSLATEEDPAVAAFGFGPAHRRDTSADQVRALKQALKE